MLVRTWILIMGMAATGIAAYYDNLAAAYVALIGGMILYQLHAIEFKLNKLLDHHHISAPDFEIAKDKTLRLGPVLSLIFSFGVGVTWLGSEVS